MSSITKFCHECKQISVSNPHWNCLSILYQVSFWCLIYTMYTSQNILWFWAQRNIITCKYYLYVFQLSYVIELEKNFGGIEFICVINMIREIRPLRWTIRQSKCKGLLLSPSSNHNYMLIFEISFKQMCPMEFRIQLWSLKWIAI